jgi:hypothetical protein
MKRLTMPFTAAFIAFSWTYSYGYLMEKMTYRDLFQQAELVVIATPVRSMNARIELPVDQPQDIKRHIASVKTEFEVAYVLKGELQEKTLSLLHLKTTVPQARTSLGSIGACFIDFEEKRNKGSPYVLFVKKFDDEHVIPAWNLMEGSRAIISVRKNGDL